WFGDNVTYKTWGDVWLREGFATFAEQLFLGHFWSAAAAKQQRQGYLTRALGKPCGMVYVNDTTTSDSLFDGANVYAKGQAVVRMLQYAAPDDSAFFRLLRTYQATYALGLASTADLKTMAETIYGYNLDTFFNQWIYSRGYPVYNMSWHQAGSTVWVKLIQTRSCNAYNSHFSTPLQLQLRSATADTFIKVYNSLDTQTYVFNWMPAMTNVYLNTDIWTLLRLNTPVIHDVKLGFTQPDKEKIKVYPNPTKNSWQIDDMQEGLALKLTDVTGRTVWEGKSGRGTTVIPGQRLATGNYYLSVDGADAEYKLIRL
ncbi:MAG: hypothetical protein H7257_10085, partial [Taibaiella sp.]|nr:hypothetical protein [Taibaiella sp.]